MAPKSMDECNLSKMLTKKVICFGLIIAFLLDNAYCVQIDVGIDHDVSGPTYGLEGKSGSQVHYDERNGLNLKGTISDLLGPPIKIANGFTNVLKGGNLANLGTSLKSGGALLGFDAKILETAGAGNLFKGGLLMGGANAKSNLAGQVAGTKGQKIASIIEVPVKVVAMKDLATGKVLNGLAQLKQTEAQAINSKGQQLYNQGQAMKTQGLNQVLQGTSEGVQNIGNMVSKTAENFNTAFKLLPLVWDMHQQSVMQQHEQGQAKGQQIVEPHEQQQQQQQHQLVATGPLHHQSQARDQSGLTGGSLFGGLSSLIPGLSSSSLSTTSSNHGLSGPNPAYAAVLNSTSPLTNLLMNPAANPFLLPLTQGPLGQAIVSKQPIGTEQAANHADRTKALPANQQMEVFDFNLIPGLHYKEAFSSQLPSINFATTSSLGGTKSSTSHHQQQQHMSTKSK